MPHSHSRARSIPLTVNKTLLNKLWLQCSMMAVGLTLSSAALAIVGATIHPADEFDSLSSTTHGSYLNINPGLAPVVNSEGYSHTAAVEVDRNTGMIRGYAGYSNATGGMVTRTGNLFSTIAGSDEEALVSSVAGTIIYDATVSGPFEVTGTTASVFIDVEGSFNYQTGAPSMGLVGAVSINVIPQGNPLGGIGYVYGGQIRNFDDASHIPDAANIFTRDDLQVFDALGNAILNPAIPGLTSTTDFINLDPDALSMRITLTIPINDGDRLIFGGTAAGGASHAFLEDFREVGVSEEGSVDAAEGYVDFLNTATLGIELPPGFTLDGPDAPPASIVSTTSPVPVPASAWLFLSGLLALFGVGRSRGHG